jgi:hypothetical protein
MALPYPVYIISPWGIVGILPYGYSPAKFWWYKIKGNWGIVG